MTAPANPSLQQLLQHPAIWKGFRDASIGNPRSGHAELDRHLPGRGWPRRGLIELITAATGIGELRLLIPTLARAGQGERPQTWVCPPHIPYAPALAAAGIDLGGLLIVQPAADRQGLWAMEQILRAGTESCVLGWSETRDTRALRRLQLAAEEGGTPLFLYRPRAALQQSSPAVLRLYLSPAASGLHIRLLKGRGVRPASFLLPDTVPVPADALAVPTSDPPATRRPARRVA